jgi:glycosyltransferase involved in cell wall biosynthesis
MSIVDISIVIACYNEEPLLVESVKKIMVIMDATHWNYELIFVDDCSRDNTRQIINRIIAENPKHLLKKNFHEKNMGRGKTVTDGILLAEGTYVGYLDIDLEVGAHYIPLMVITLQQGADIATAFRVYKENINLLVRTVLSVGYRFLMHRMLKIPVKDTETGYKFFNRKKILPILKETKDPGWFWDTEIMALSYHANLKIVENPCLFIRRYDKKSSVNIFRDSFEYFTKLVKFSRELKTARNK